MEKVSVEAFDRVGFALLGVIKEDASTIEALKVANAQLIEGAQKAWAQVNKEVLENGKLLNKINRLLDVCEAQEALADDFGVSRDDADVSVSEIREILGP